MKQSNLFRLKNFNIAFFASIMGFWWLTLATHKLESIIWWEIYFSQYLLIISVLLFLTISILYVIKYFLNPEWVKEDFNHPVKSNFFPWIWKILIIFSIWFIFIDSSLLTSKIFWIMWVVIQFTFAVILFRRWIVHDMEIKTMNPLWFLPIVWNLLAPIAWVKLWFVELSRFLFSVWFIMWLVIFTVIINRIIFHHPMPDKLIPTLFILVAPWSVASLSYTSLNWWDYSDLARICFYFSIFIFIIILSKINILTRLKFYLSWWAYSFPMAVLTSATFLYYESSKVEWILYIWYLFYALLVSIILILIFRTILWMKEWEICIEEK